MFGKLKTKLHHWKPSAQDEIASCLDHWRYQTPLALPVMAEIFLLVALASAAIYLGCIEWHQLTAIPGGHEQRTCPQSLSPQLPKNPSWPSTRTKGTSRMKPSMGHQKQISSIGVCRWHNITSLNSLMWLVFTPFTEDVVFLKMHQGCGQFRCKYYQVVIRIKRTSLPSA